MIRRILKRVRSASTRSAEPRPRPVTAPRPVTRPLPSTAIPPAPAIPSPDAPRELLLYRDDYCGFCRRVDRVVEKLGLDVPSVDTPADRQARETHRDRTGRSTVPCLYIDDVPLFESADIMEWLEAYAQSGAVKDRTTAEGEQGVRETAPD